jgi:hypothetical protein
VKVKVLKLTPEAYREYASTVKDNEEVSHDQAARKLSRNIHYVKDILPENVERKWLSATFHYGNLEIVTKLGKIVKVINHKGGGVSLKIDKKYYNALSTLYQCESKFDHRHKNKLSKRK